LASVIISLVLRPYLMVLFCKLLGQRSERLSFDQITQRLEMLKIGEEYEKINFDINKYHQFVVDFTKSKTYEYF